MWLRLAGSAEQRYVIANTDPYATANGEGIHCLLASRDGRAA